MTTKGQNWAGNIFLPHLSSYCRVLVSELWPYMNQNLERGKLGVEYYEVHLVWLCPRQCSLHQHFVSILPLIKCVHPYPCLHTEDNIRNIMEMCLNPIATGHASHFKLSLSLLAKDWPYSSAVVAQRGKQLYMAQCSLWPQIKVTTNNSYQIVNDDFLLLSYGRWCEDIVHMDLCGGATT